MKYTVEQFLEHLRSGLGENCLVCDNPLSLHWTDLHGEAKCFTCGMPYQIITPKFKASWLESVGLRIDEIAQRHCPGFVAVPLYRAYWEDQHKPLPLGQYIWDERRKWITVADEIAYFSWLVQHAAEYQVEYSDWYKWDVLLADESLKVVKEAADGTNTNPHP